MMYPRSELAPGDPKGALFLVQLHVEVPEVSRGFFLVSDETATLPSLHDDVIDIDLHVALDLPFKIGLYTPLVGGPPCSLIRTTFLCSRRI
jgi:hypothetical protein